MTSTTTANLRLAPDALAVREIGPWLFTALADVDSGTAGPLLARMELAVHEVCMNVVDHAELPAGALIELSLALSPEALTVRVCDPGAEFDFDAIPNPATDVLQERGYGVKIARKLVDDVTYRRTSTGNELTLRIDLRSEHGS